MRNYRAQALAVLAALAAVGATPATAFAQQSSFRLRYEAPSECPDQETLCARVLARSRRGRLAAGDELARTMQLSIRADRGQYVGVLSFVDLESRPVQRELGASTCEALVDALVLVTALAVDAQAPSEAWLDRVDAPAEYYAPRGLELVSAPVDTVVDPSAFEPRRHSASTPFVALALARVNTAALPAWGMGLIGLIGLPWPGGRYAAEAGFGWGGGSARVQGETARFNVAHGIARVCAWYAVGVHAQAGACGGPEAGVLFGRGQESERITSAFDHRSVWLGLGLVGRFRLQLRSRLSIESELGALAPLYRPRFELDVPDVPRNLLVFRSPSVGLLAGLGLGLALD